MKKSHVLLFAWGIAKRQARSAGVTKAHDPYSLYVKKTQNKKKVYFFFY